jgi:hypothetical protein
MAYSFCFAPLHAARSLGATATRCDLIRSSHDDIIVRGCRIVVEANPEICSATGIRWLSTQGVSSVGKCPLYKGLRGGLHKQNAAAELVPQRKSLQKTAP